MADLETCCVCLDSLSSAAVTLLLDSGSTRACPHYIHHECARLLTPRRCPLCRTSFVALSTPIQRNIFKRTRPATILISLRRLAGSPALQSGAVSAPTRDIIGLLVATLPKPEDSVYAAVVAVSVSQDAERELGVGEFEDLLDLLGVRNDSPTSPVGSSSLASIEGYTISTRLWRRLNWLLLKLAGVSGAALFCGGCGTSVGILLGGAFAVPVNRWPDLDGNISQIEIAFKMGWMLCLVAYYGAQRKDLVMSGLRYGSAFGFIFGCFRGLVYVNPENHGLRSVFWRGLSGQTTLAALPGRSGATHRSRLREDVDVFTS